MQSRVWIAAAAVITMAVLATLGAGVAKSAGVGDVTPPKPRTTRAPWPAPSDPLIRARQAGLIPERKETLIYHVHAHLDVFVNRQVIRGPAGIGINIADPGVRRFKEPDGSTAYGGIALCVKPCISPLHTHDNSGVIHTETATPRPNRLSQFFTEWGVRLSRTCVGGYCNPTPIRWYVNGKRFSGNPREILLSDKKEIALVIGTRPKKIPASYDFSNA
jgi:hypothetical protein